METVDVNTSDLKKLIKDVEQIKKMMIEEKKEREMEELELTNWAKDELREARKTPNEDYVSLEEIKKKRAAKNEL